MSDRIWFFADGSERRVEVKVVTHRAVANNDSIELPETERLWVIPCGNCGTNFTLRHEHGIVVGTDGALTTLPLIQLPEVHELAPHGTRWSADPVTTSPTPPKE